MPCGVGERLRRCETSAGEAAGRSWSRITRATTVDQGKNAEPRARRADAPTNETPARTLTFWLGDDILGPCGALDRRIDGGSTRRQRQREWLSPTRQ